MMIKISKETIFTMKLNESKLLVIEEALKKYMIQLHEGEKFIHQEISEIIHEINKAR